LKAAIFSFALNADTSASSFLDGRKPEIVSKGNERAAHYGNSGVCEMMDMASQLRTALNDAAAKCQMDNDGVDVPKSFG
jgi:hypothetical protein